MSLTRETERRLCKTCKYFGETYGECCLCENNGLYTPRETRYSGFKLQDLFSNLKQGEHVSIRITGAKGASLQLYSGSSYSDYSNDIKGSYFEDVSELEFETVAQTKSYTSLYDVNKRVSVGVFKPDTTTYCERCSVPLYVELDAERKLYGKVGKRFCAYCGTKLGGSK